MIKEIVKEIITKLIVGVLVFLFTAAAARHVGEKFMVFNGFMESKWYLWAGLLVGAVVVLAMVLPRFLKMAMFRKEYGLLWDGELKPHCPACKTLLSGLRDSVDELLCSHCKQRLSIMDGSTIRMTEEQAREKLRTKGR